MPAGQNINVTPAKAGVRERLDSGFRRNDGFVSHAPSPRRSHPSDAVPPFAAAPQLAAGGGLF